MDYLYLCAKEQIYNNFLKMIKKYVFSAAFLFYATSTWAQNGIIRQSDIEKAKFITQQMTLEEKISYISGYKDFSIRPVPRLGLPEVKMADGPQGVRNNVKSTMYPCGILTAATWNRALARRVGESLGRDSRQYGLGFFLGPGVNIYRAPMNGRNFEYFGEDPYLVSETAKAYILGVQSQGVIATVKHFAMNNQEWSRHVVSSDADERTIQEIYFPAFRKAVQEAHVGAVMGSYNLINGVHATENAWLNREVLRNQWGFKGILMSDWVSVYSGPMAVLGGLDLEMPSGKFMNAQELLPALKNGIIKESMIDRQVEHILQTLSSFGLLDTPRAAVPTGKDIASSKGTALDDAREGIVLLKNDEDVLPLKGSAVVFGPNADNLPKGGGSGFVEPYSSISVWKGLQALKGRQASLLSENQYTMPLALTFKATYYDNRDFAGAAVISRNEKGVSHDWGSDSPGEGMPKDHFSVRWTTTYQPKTDEIIRISMNGDDGYRFKIDDKEVLADWRTHGVTSKEACVKLEKEKTYHLCAEYFEWDQGASVHLDMAKLNTELMKEKLSKADNAVVCVGFNSDSEGEDFDRPFELSTWQQYLINMATANCKKTIVVVNSGGGIRFKPWIDKTKAVLMAWYPGQEGGQAIAEILTGKVSPSGKLPISIEEKWEDNPVHDSYYDDRNVAHKRVLYSEGLFLGYRGYDRTGKKPLFPFGYGLSYSTFTYNGLQVEKKDNGKVTVTFTVKNVGNRAADEICQLYVHCVQSQEPVPYKELKGYEKVKLQRGESKQVTIELDESSFSHYDTDSHRFVVVPGEYEILVGTSSADLSLRAKINL